MHKKSQITLFIILGIIILGIVAFMFYITESRIEKKIEEPIDQTVREFLKSRTINYYVTTCLDTASKQALTLIGEQGGFIHKEQDGLIDWNIPYIEYDNKNVSYQIYSSISGEIKKKDQVVNEPYLYPCLKKGPYDSVGINCHNEYDNLKALYYFGSTREPEKNIEPALCKTKILMPAYICDCYPPNSPNCKYSIQAQMEDFIKKKVKECADFSTIKGYNITAGEIEANVTFSNKHVLFKINFPITITVKGSQPIINVLEFSLPQQVRFKTVYSIARQIIEKDINDINFDIVKDGQEIANNYGEGFKLKRDDIYTNSSIIIIEDTQSHIDGKNYSFMFARENRAPALNFMKFIDFTYLDYYDYYIIENQTLNFTPTAFDPDESQIEYEYLDWKGNELMKSRIYKYTKEDECIHPFSEQSERYRCAVYDLQYPDIDAGEHGVTIKPEDPGNLYDFQDIYLLVDDIPKIVAETYNEYGDIPNNKASIEDPFYIDLFKSTDKYPEQNKLLYRLWKTEPASLIYGWTSNTLLQIPKDTADIRTIKDKEFTLPAGVKSQKQTLIIDAENEIETPLENIGVKKIDIDLYQCLPHRSSHPPWPFNDITWDIDYLPTGTVVDDFQGSHTCCSTDPWGTYEDTSKNCYSLIDYGCITDFIDPESPYYDPGGLIEKRIKIPDISRAGGSDEQEIYKRVLVVNCNGERGNTCDNVIKYTIKPVSKTCIGTCKHSFNKDNACG